MQHDRKTRHYAPDPSGRVWHALSMSGLWLRASFIGASAFVSGFIVAARGESTALAALALVLGGAVIAVYSWRRARSVLERADAWDADASSAARGAGDDGRVRYAVLGIE